VTTSTLGFAAAAGLVAAVNPCGFAMLSSYVTLVVLGVGTQRSRPAAVARALAATAVMALGFLVVFAVFGLVLAPIAGEVQRYLPIATIVIGAALVGLGAWFLTGREVGLLLPRPGGAPTARLGSMFGYGLAYAVASLSCTIGPFLAVTGATFRAGSIGEGVLAYLAYGAGMALVVGVLATGVALGGAGFATRARRLLPYVTRIGGGLLVLIGLYVGYYGIYATRVNLGHADPHDPVVHATGTVQQTLVEWVDTIGVTPLLIALATIVGAAFAVKRLSTRNQ
jgi:cytochrome c biogenesis protein CcdA